MTRFVYTPVMFDDDQKFKCYSACTWEKAGALLPNGKIDQSLLFKTLDTLDAESKLIILNMVKLCFRPKAKDNCNKIYSIMSCMKKTDMEHFFFL